MCGARIYPWDGEAPRSRCRLVVQGSGELAPEVEGNEGAGDDEGEMEEEFYFEESHKVIHAIYAVHVVVRPPRYEGPCGCNERSEREGSREV